MGYSRQRPDPTVTGSFPPRSELYRTIHTQPDVIQSVLDNADDIPRRAAEILRKARRIVLAGTGTSSHAAVVGEHLLRSAGFDAYATTNFDFVSYPRPIQAEDAFVAISHRGSKRFGTQAIERAVVSGAQIVGVTGQDSPMKGPNVVIYTAPQETSSTHTASYTANLAALALMTVHAGQPGQLTSDLRTALYGIPSSIDSILRRETEIVPSAQALAASGRLILLGAGPNAVTAREGALKVKESSFLVAEGFELETCLHGGLQAVEAGDVAAIVVAHGPGLLRTLDAINALRLIGAHLLFIADERVVPQLPTPHEGDTIITYDPVPEPLSPLLATIPLQLLAAYTASLRGTNADRFRADEPAHRRANEIYGL
jgi:glutamine---fructose-6-phosphate transaminase (isomerizing)